MTQRESAPPTSDGRGPQVQEARTQAVNVGQGAAQTGGQVARNAVGQGKETAAEARQQARNLFGEASEQLKEQADAQQKRAATGLRSLSDELQAMSSRSEQQGMATELARQASDRAGQAADWLEHREPGMVVEEIRDYARRHPGMFLAGAAVAGILAGRLTRGLATREASDGTEGGGPAHPGTAPTGGVGS